MQWSDEAILISVRLHGESAGIAELLTRNHGRYLGVVHGIASTRNRATLQPGNRLMVTWRARMPEQLGVIAAELALARAPGLFEQRSALVGLNAAIAVATAALPEREPHERVYRATDALLDSIGGGELPEWGPVFVVWELGLLNELGFGLDLTHCAVTGTPDDLVYVSPRSGRAVSREAGSEYSDRLLSLPPFLRPDGPAEASVTDILAGLRLTAYFLNRRVLQPCSKTMPHARQRLEEFTVRETGKHVAMSSHNG